MVREGLLVDRADGIWELATATEVHQEAEPTQINPSVGTEWLVVSNPSLYNSVGAFQALPEIDWSETAVRIVVGDIVYLYGSAPIRGLSHQCLVIATGLPAGDLVDDEVFRVDAEALEARQRRTWMRLRLLHAFDEAESSQLDLESLARVGLTRAPQSRQRATPQVSQLIAEVLGQRDVAVSDDQASESAGSDPSQVSDFRRSIMEGNFTVLNRYATSKTRGSAQRAFAERVKRNYGYRCAITGVSSREFLVASHIVPWGADESSRLDPSNGICLSTLVDRAFDTGYLRIGVDSTVSIDIARLERDPAMYDLLAPMHGSKLARPLADPPSPQHLRRRLALNGD
jgi:hypothetical protein